MEKIDFPIVSIVFLLCYAVRFCAVLKAAGLNIFRAAAYRKAEMPAKTGDERDTFIVFKMILGLKDFWSVIISHFEESFGSWWEKSDHVLQNAA